jgi:hypothetical protein
MGASQPHTVAATGACDACEPRRASYLCTRFLDCFPLKSTGNCRYYVSNDGVKDVNGKTIRISCGAPAGETSDRYRRCGVTFQIAEDVTVYYNFYDKYIGDWKTIHKVISEFLVAEKD